MVKVSVIVPVYNARDFLVPCLESLASQTLDDIEIVIVDDHGTDGSIELAHEWLAHHAGRKQVTFLSTPSNSGPGAARNVGIESAQGEYVAFLDSDDWVEVDFCELLYKAAHKRDADLAYCHISMDNRRNDSSRVMLNPVVSNGEFTVKKHKSFLTKYVSYFTTFIYRREFLIDSALRFPATRSSEDSAFLLCSVLAAKSVAVVEKPLYHYVIHGESLTTALDMGKYREKMDSFDEVMSYARRHVLYDTYKDEIDFIYVKKAALMAAYTYVANVTSPERKTMSEIHERLEKTVPDYKSNRYVRRSLKVRWLAFMMRKWPWLACRIIARRVKKTAEK